MKDSTLHNISLARFRSLFPSSPSVGLGDDFYILDARLEKSHQPMNHPCRFDGFMFLYCVKGRLKMNVNLTEFEISEGMVFMNVPGNIIRVNEIIDTPQEDVRYLCLAMSRDFTQGLKVEVNKLFNEGVSMLEKPTIQLNETESKLTCNLIHHLVGLLQSEIPYKKESILSSLSSLFYILMGAWRVEALKREDDAKSVRSKVIFEKFMRLVSDYHTQQRNVGFYADKLCLTPKYLSKIIKNTTGRSAPEWIDSYVILEAKNLLKYSGITIKEIVYKLNFPNQSVFYKFFKARTGMTPTEYRNS